MFIYSYIAINMPVEGVFNPTCQTKQLYLWSQAGYLFVQVRWSHFKVHSSMSDKTQKQATAKYPGELSIRILA